MTPKASLEHLAPTEQRALVEFVQLLRERFNGLVRSALLFGSKARGEKTLDSDLDVLVVVDSDDWRLHKQIRYLAEVQLKSVTPCLECFPPPGGRRTSDPALPEHPPGWHQPLGDRCCS